MTLLHRLSDVAKKPILSIRFVGENLDVSSLPIYELGLVLISAQRLFHKAYLVEQERLEKRAYPDKKERRHLALQIGAHEKGSDLYTLVAFVADPTVMSTLQTAAKFVMSGLASYAMKNVLERLRGKDREPKRQVYIGSIHAEVVNFVDRIEGVGGTETIQIRAPVLAQPRTINFDREAKAYVHAIAGEFYLGPVQELKGVVYKLYPNIQMAEIRRHPGNRKCKLFLNQQDFHRVRYSEARSPVIAVVGRPRFKIGTERHSFDELEVSKIKSLSDEQPELPVTS